MSERGVDGRPRIRHVAICTGDPWAAEARVHDFLRLAVVQRDEYNPSIGIRNGVFALQDTFLEITTPGSNEAPTQRFLNKRGEGGYMICLQVPDLEEAVARAEAMGVRIVLRIDQHRVGHQQVSSAHLHPADTGGTLFSFEQADPPESWAYAGHAWRDYRRGDVVRDIVGAQIATAQPEELAQHLGRLFAVEPGGHTLSLAGGRIVLTAAEPNARDAFHTIEMFASDRGRAGEASEIAGVTVKLV